VPAESAVTASAMPASAASFLKTASAVGDRQMFPVQTNKTPNFFPDIGLPNIESARETDFGTPAAGLLALQPAVGLAQDWPSKPIRVVIPFCAGSVSEAIFRTISPGVETSLGQRFVVESKPGADGAIGTVKSCALRPTATPCCSGRRRLCRDASHVQEPRLRSAHALDPISLLADAPLLAVVGANVPAKSLKELAEYVSAQPGKFNYGSPGSGSPAHLAGAAFSQQTGNSMVYVPYKGTPPMVQALLAGDIQVAFPTLTGIIGPVKAGKLKVLAVMARERMSELPDVPRRSKRGFPNSWAATGGCSRRPAHESTHRRTPGGRVRRALADPAVAQARERLRPLAIGLAPRRRRLPQVGIGALKSSSNWAASNRSERDFRKRSRREALTPRRSDGGGRDRRSRRRRKSVAQRLSAFRGRHHPVEGHAFAFICEGPARIIVEHPTEAARLRSERAELDVRWSLCAIAEAEAAIRELGGRRIAIAPLAAVLIVLR